MEDIILTQNTPPTGEIVPGTVGNVCFEVRNSEVRWPVDERLLLLPIVGVQQVTIALPRLQAITGRRRHLLMANIVTHEPPIRLMSRETR